MGEHRVPQPRHRSLSAQALTVQHFFGSLGVGLEPETGCALLLLPPHPHTCRHHCLSPCLLDGKCARAAPCPPVISPSIGRSRRSFLCVSHLHRRRERERGRDGGKGIEVACRRRHRRRSLTVAASPIIQMSSTMPHPSCTGWEALDPVTGAFYNVAERVCRAHVLALSNLSWDRSRSWISNLAKYSASLSRPGRQPGLHQAMSDEALPQSMRPARHTVLDSRLRSKLKRRNMNHVDGGRASSKRLKRG